MKTDDLIAMLASGPDVAAAPPPGARLHALATLGAGLLASVALMAGQRFAINKQLGTDPRPRRNDMERVMLRGQIAISRGRYIVEYMHVLRVEECL